MTSRPPVSTPRSTETLGLSCDQIGRALKARGITPCGAGDTSAGMEYELQIAVEGKTAEVDLPPSAIEDLRQAR